MKENDTCIKEVVILPSVVELRFSDNAIRRYPMKKINEYANLKPPSIEDLEQFQATIDKVVWFSRKGRKPTLRALSKEYIRALKTDPDYPVIVLNGLFMSAVQSRPYSRRVLLDGTHRLLKCLITDRKTLSVVLVTARELQMNVTEIKQ